MTRRSALLFVALAACAAPEAEPLAGDTVVRDWRLVKGVFPGRADRNTPPAP